MLIDLVFAYNISDLLTHYLSLQKETIHVHRMLHLVHKIFILGDLVEKTSC